MNQDMAFPEPILSIIPLGSLANSIFGQINPNEKKKKKKKEKKKKKKADTTRPFLTSDESTARGID